MSCSSKKQFELSSLVRLENVFFKCWVSRQFNLYMFSLFLFFSSISSRWTVKCVTWNVISHFRFRPCKIPKNSVQVWSNADKLVKLLFWGRNDIFMGFKWKQTKTFVELTSGISFHIEMGCVSAAHTQLCCCSSCCFFCTAKAV